MLPFYYQREFKFDTLCPLSSIYAFNENLTPETPKAFPELIPVNPSTIWIPHPTDPVVLAFQPWEQPDETHPDLHPEEDRMLILMMIIMVAFRYKIV